jgi:predicted HAD superfamily hydrolase
MKELQILRTRLHKHQLKSFDVFDTLIARDCFTPKGIFHLVEREAQKHGLWVPEDYAICRVQSEESARRKTTNEEVTIDDILLELIDAYGATRAPALRCLLELECALEIRAAYAISPLAELVTSIPKESIVFISDMYLPLAVVRAAISKAAPNLAAVPLYLSSDTLLTKNKGTIFDHVLSSKKIQASEVIHVGDNAHSDARIPRNKGLSVWHLDWTKETDWETRLFKRLTNSLSRTPHGTLFAELLVGAARKSRLTSPLTAQVLGSDRYKLGREVAGPILCLYVLWLLQKAKEDGVTTLWFLARDGQILQELATKFASRLPFHFQSRYIYASRQAWNLPGLKKIDEAALSWILQELPHVTIGIVSARLQLDKTTLLQTYRNAVGKQINDNQILSTKELAILRKVLTSEPILSSVLSSAKSARKELVSYLKKQGSLKGERLGIVDLGWRGRLQDSLYNFIREQGYAQLHGYYMGLLCDTDASSKSTKTAFLFNQQELKHLESRARPFINLAEIFCAADHGTTLGYERGHPVLKQQTNSEALEWGLEDFRNGIRHFADSISPEMLELARDHSHLSRLAAVSVIEELITNPTESQAEAVGSFHFSGDQTEAYMRELAPPLTPQSALRYLCHDDYPTRSSITLWLTGSLARSDLETRGIFVQFWESLKWHNAPDASTRLSCVLTKAVLKCLSHSSKGRTEIDSVAEPFLCCLDSKVRSLLASLDGSAQLDGFLEEEAEVVCKSFFDEHESGRECEPLSYDNGPQFVRSTLLTWLLRHDPSAKQQLLLANFTVAHTQGKTLSALLEIEADQQLRAHISIGRAGTRTYEGSGEDAVLQPNQPKAFILQHRFKGEHRGVKVQVDVKHCAAPQATISIKHCILLPFGNEIMGSIPKDSSLVREANRNFREKRYAQSAALYAAAARALGLKTFEFNARLSLRRLGISEEALISDVLARQA